jgi:hypothetical protein
MKNLKKTLEKKKPAGNQIKGLGGKPFIISKKTLNILKGIKKDKSWNETFELLINFYLNNN